MSDVAEEPASGCFSCRKALSSCETLMNVFLEVGTFFEGQLDFHDLNIIIGKLLSLQINGPLFHSKNRLVIYYFSFLPLLTIVGHYLSVKPLLTGSQ